MNGSSTPSLSKALRGQPIGAYCIAKLKDGVTYREFMTPRRERSRKKFLKGETRSLACFFGLENVEKDRASTVVETPADVNGSDRHRR